MRGGKQVDAKAADEDRIVGAKQEEIDDGRKQCPYCRRKFNPDPYERHLNVCPRRLEKERVKVR